MVDRYAMMRGRTDCATNPLVDVCHPRRFLEEVDGMAWSLNLDVGSHLDPLLAMKGLRKQDSSRGLSWES